MALIKYQLNGSVNMEAEDDRYTASRLPDESGIIISATDAVLEVTEFRARPTVDGMAIVADVIFSYTDGGGLSRQDAVTIEFENIAIDAVDPTFRGTIAALVEGLAAGVIPALLEDATATPIT